jgi:predicted nucleic acid-binding Zn ribbon protein
MHKFCKECGKEFFVFSNNNKFCSPECRLNYYKRYMKEYVIKHAKPKKKIICVICGKEFLQYKPGKLVTCSKECSTKYKKMYSNIHSKENNRRFKEKNPDYGKQWRETHKENILIYNKKNRLQKKERYLKNRKLKNCVICGKTFFGHGKSCSEDCRKKYYNQPRKKYKYISKYVKKYGVSKNCIICSKTFISLNHTKTCSKECSKTLQLKTLREYHRKRFHELQLIVFKHYSHNKLECACCGENHLEFLSLDHIVPLFNRKKKRDMYKLFLYLINNNFPEGYQILCTGCNWLKNTFNVQFCYAHHPELYTIPPKRVKDKYWKLILEHYTSKCVCCGETNKHLLTVDHVHGNGKKDVRSIQLYKKIVDQNYPNDYQILCIKCNMFKSNKDKQYCSVHHPKIYPV